MGVVQGDYMAKTSIFINTLLKFRGDESPIGDLANDAASDPGVVGDMDARRCHRHIVNNRADPAAVAALRELCATAIAQFELDND